MAAAGGGHIQASLEIQLVSTAVKYSMCTQAAKFPNTCSMAAASAVECNCNNQEAVWHGSIWVFLTLKFMLLVFMSLNKDVSPREVKT